MDWLDFVVMVVKVSINVCFTRIWNVFYWLKSCKVGLIRGFIKNIAFNYRWESFFFFPETKEAI